MSEHTTAVSRAAATADAVAAAARACPGVVDLSVGGFRSVTTLLPGRRVDGVRVDDDRLEVGVVVAAGRPVREVAERVRAAVASVAGGLPVDVHVADVAVPGEDDESGEDEEPDASGRPGGTVEDADPQTQAEAGLGHA